VGDDEKANGGEEPGGGPSKGAAAWPLWKKLAFSIAALCVVAGVGLRVYGIMVPPEEGKVRVGAPSSPLIGESARGQPQGLVQGLAAGGVTGASTDSGQSGSAADGRLSDQAAPILTQSGLAFFAAFCVGAALRLAAKAAVVGIGFLLLAWIGLAMAGVLPPIDWAAMDGPFRTFMGHVQALVGKIEGALTHALPSGTMAGIGLASGLKKGS